ncbi:hypothetical protein Isop_0395 [Isosphaera pallida ATCC 43644]|jgi:nitrogen fixation-related uncharacterized protein|uniref:Cytochrome oxidase maturation protein, cbb3-type n=1 Tax=Isosphaera pallida (strain ATCC 43644 / DSM 9630 / IS1B) TaxID=575540 RepID=E8QYL4_ISOPI|nr:cbb3-type cytochrome oxidase assembly protein CcoS [Isosphaera pallida]ADV60990.1 hypothetical protein Isop_0395 [Isosphaera pallida ATCC 43644]
MTLYVAVVLGGAAAFCGVAALALAWAFRTGQFGDLQAGARSIFDEAEPIGSTTDDGFASPTSSADSSSSSSRSRS